MIAPLCACSGGLQGRQAARIVELENYTQELEAKVTMLKEASLKATARTGCLSSRPDPKQGRGSEPASVAVAQASAHGGANQEQARSSAVTSAPADLPVVRLSPTHPFASAQDDQRSDEPEADLDSAQASNDASAVSDETRPVLKLHGAQEGKVYIRTLTAAEKDTTL